MSLWRWLERAAAQGLVCRSGQGKRNDSFRYWLPGMEEKWKASPFRLDELPDMEDFYR